MAIRLPVVIGTDGLLQQLQAGDSIQSPTNAPSIRSVTNGESSVAITIGMPVYASAADAVKRAQANAKATSGVIGLVYDVTIAAGASGNIAESGVLVATTVQWDSVAGTTGGLVFNTIYFLDPATPGKITSTVPTTVGQVNLPLGRALSTTELDILLGRDPILL
jgi:hypothetical protein